MTRKLILLIAFCLALFPFSGSSPAARKEKFHFGNVGLIRRQFIPPEPFDWRAAQSHAIITDIWYPAAPSAIEKEQWVGSPSAPFAIAGKAAPDAPLLAAPAKFPLILLSHGTGGSSSMMAWLGISLASHGYIAAAVNHPGNNALEPYTAQGFTLWWERAHDLSVVLDKLLADSTFGPRIDPSRIGAAGFSLGGYTVIELAGGIGDFSRLEAFCKTPNANSLCTDPPEFPGLSAKVKSLIASDQSFAAALRGGADSHRDSRIRAVFAIAPALGPAFSADSLARISIPVQILAGSADTIVPLDTSAKFFAANIPGAQLTIIQDVGHYTFLAKCLPLGNRTQPQLCLDRAGILRDDIHAQASNLAFQFFQSNLR
ncbi:MAG TPA: hypothetical protein VJO16_02285 [Candidatus Acidoferrum sp.]|nr:hypothetical protein [Candidatus Acidoferrum sp.]